MTTINFLCIILIGFLGVIAQDLRIFAPFSLFQVDLDTANCLYGETTSIQPFYFGTIPYAIVNQGNCGFTIYNMSSSTNPTVVFTQMIPGYACTSIYYSENFELLIVGFANGQLNIYSVQAANSSNTLVELTNHSTLQNSEVVYFIKNNPQILNNLFFFSLNSLIIVQLTQSSQILQVQQLQQSFQNAFQIDIIGNTEYVFVATQNQGLQMTQITSTAISSNSQQSYSLGKICYLNPLIYTINSFQMLNSNIVVMMQVILGVYVYDISNYINSQGATCSFTKLYQLPQSTLGNKVLLSADKTYLYASYQSVGIYIYQITTTSATLVQTIWQIGNGDHILTENENLLLTTNSLSFLGYQATKPNLNNIAPNLLLNYQQMQLVPAVTKPGQDRDCIYNPSNQLIFLISPSYSFLVMKYQGNGVFQNLFTQINSGKRFIVYAFMLSDNITVIAATRSNGIAIMDFRNPSQPVYVKEGITFGIQSMVLFTMAITNDEKVLVLADNTRAIFVSLVDPYNPQLLSVYDITTNGSSPPLQRMKFSIDFKVLFLSTVTDSIMAIDVSSFQNPVFLSKISVQGVNQLRVTQDGKNLIFANVFKGMVNVDISDPKNMKIVSSITVVGAALSVELINSDQYILMTSTGNPTIKLIDFRNRTNPLDYQLFFLQSRSYDFVQICKANNDQTIFISSDSSMISLNLKNTLHLHTQIYSVQKSTTSNQEQLTIIDPTLPFLVGQSIQMSFMNILDQSLISITDAYFYTNDSIQSLPSWIVFSQMSNFLSLSITKESITTGSAQQIVLKVLRQIQSTAFVNNVLQLGQTQSATLKNSCLKSRYIDSNSFVSTQFGSQGYFVLDSTDLNSITTDLNQQQLITQFVFYILKSNIVYYTIPISIKPSLTIDFTKPYSPIMSNQNTISVYLTCEDPKKGQFINESYPSVLVVYSDQFNQIKLEGTLESINHLLSLKIRFHNATDPSLIQINVQVQDGVNFDYLKDFNITQLPIIQLQKQVQIEPQKTLQDYFNDKYSSSELEINTYFSFQIPQAHYISDQNYPLTFTVYPLNRNEYSSLQKIYKNGDYSEFEKEYKINPIGSSYWIQFSSSDQVITGIPSSNNLFTKYYLMINVTDGYTFVLEPLMIDVDQIPFNYVLQIIIQIGGPLIGILGLWKFKYLFFNTFFKQYYLYSPETAFVGQTFSKHIYLYGDSLPLAIQICQKYLPNILSNKFIEDQVSALLSERKKSFMAESISSPIKLTDQQLPANNMHDSSFGNQTSMNSYINNFLKKSKLSRQRSNSQAKKQQQQSMSSSFIMNQTKKLQIKLKQFQNKENQEQLSLFETKGNINISYIVQKILNLIQATRNSFKDNKEMITNLNNPKSAFYQIISGLIILFIKDKIKTSSYIFKRMRNCALKQYNKKDWYRLYVNIDRLPPSLEIEDMCFFDLFKINHERFHSDFEESLEFIQNMHEDQIHQHYLDTALFSFSFIIQLVQDSVIATAQGISYNKRGVTFRGQGESINSDQHEIKTIKAYQKSQNKTSGCLKMCRNQTFKEKFLIQNQMIPSWIKKVELVNNIIVIQGIPLRQNIGNTLLKILNESNIVQYAFEIDIREPEKTDSIQQQPNAFFSERVLKYASPIIKKKNFSPSGFELTRSPYPLCLNTDQIHEPEHFQLTFSEPTDQIASSPKSFMAKSNKMQMESDY